VRFILGAGFAAGILDILNAIVFWRLYSGASATAILQSVAAGLLGRSAFAGGAASAAFGLALHLLIMLAMAAVYWVASRRYRWMLVHPVPAGIGYGLLTWTVMNYAVVPLSRAEPPPFIPAWFVDGLLAHVLLVGLLFAFAARRSFLRGRPA
jgi:hypothetical protein